MNLSILDNRIDKAHNEYIRQKQELENLKFIKEKLFRGSEDEIKLIKLVSQLTIDNINVLLKTLDDNIKRGIG